MIPVSIIFYEKSFVECCLCGVDTSQEHHKIIMNDSEDREPTIKCLCDYCFKFIRGELK